MATKTGTNDSFVVHERFGRGGAIRERPVMAAWTGVA
jgi:hypothetical protein